MGSEGALGIVRPLVDFQHVFHVGDKGGAGLGRDHPLLLAMGLENVFLIVCPIVLSLALPTICNSTTFSSKRRSVHLAWPAGADPQARAISLASAAPSKIRRGADLGLSLRVRTASKPSTTSCRRVRSIVAMLASSASAIPAVAPSLAGLRHVRFQKDASFGQQMRGALAPADKVVEPGALLFAQLDYELLDAQPLGLATNYLHRAIAKASIQTIPSNSMT